jgi:hypothetical protein
MPWRCMEKWRYIAPYIFNFGTRWRWVISSMLQPLFSQRKSPQYIFDTRLDGSQSCCELCAGKKNILLLPGIKPQILGRLAHSLVMKTWWIIYLIVTVMEIWGSRTFKCHRSDYTVFVDCANVLSCQKLMQWLPMKSAVRQADRLQTPSKGFLKHSDMYSVTILYS